MKLTAKQIKKYSKLSKRTIYRRLKEFRENENIEFSKEGRTYVYDSEIVSKPLMFLYKKTMVDCIGNNETEKDIKIKELERKLLLIKKIAE